MNEGRSLDTERLQAQLRDFASERDWGQFHSPKNLAMAIAGEVGELVEIFQWLSEEQASSLSEYDRARVAEELADIQIYLLQISDELDISLADSVDSKIASNALRYPVEKFKGIAKKAPRSGDG